MEWIVENWSSIVLVITSLCTAASVIVKLTPSLKDDNVVLPIIKWIAKYLALNTNSPKDRPK